MSFKLSQAQIKKILILNLAKSKKNKPSRVSKSKKMKNLGQALSHYISKNQSTYDADFTNELKSIRPDWFKTK